MSGLRFYLTIDFGNEAMATQNDLGRALVALGRSLLVPGDRTPREGDGDPVRDENGNRVGGWHVAEDDRTACQKNGGCAGCNWGAADH